MRRRRLPRVLISAATGLSLLLAAATAVLWVRSGLLYRPDALHRFGDGGQILCVQSVRHILLIQLVRPGREFAPGPKPPGTWEWGYHRNGPWTLYTPVRSTSNGGQTREVGTDTSGFDAGAAYSLWYHQRGYPPRASPCRFVAIPYGFIVPLTTLLPLAAIVRLARRRRRRPRGRGRPGRLLHDVGRLPQWRGDGASRQCRL